MVSLGAMGTVQVCNHGDGCFHAVCRILPRLIIEYLFLLSIYVNLD